MYQEKNVYGERNNEFRCDETSQYIDTEGGAGIVQYTV